jgi:hypothetical protein
LMTAEAEVRTSLLVRLRRLSCIWAATVTVISGTCQLAMLLLLLLSMAVLLLVLRHARLPRGSPFVLKATRLVAAGRAQRKNPLKILTSLASPLSLTLMKMWTRAAHSLAAAPHSTRSQADPGQTVPGHLTRTVAACTRRGATEVRPSCTRTTRTKARTMCVRHLVR